MFDIDHCGYFVLRTPLLPFNEARDWGASLTCANHWRIKGTCESTLLSWSADVSLLRRRLQAIVARPEITQALAIASPSLHAAIPAWENNPDSKKGLQAERSLVRYFMRMTSRPTPFGLFSGFSVGHIGPHCVSELSLASRARYKSVTRLDYDYLFSLTSELRKTVSLQQHLRYSLNSSLQATGTNWYYVESRSVEGIRSHQLVKLERDEHLDRIIAFVRIADRSFEDLSKHIQDSVESTDITAEEGAEYIGELIANDVLIASIMPTVTGRSSLDVLLETLRTIPSATPFYKTLFTLQQSLTSLDERVFSVHPEEYHSLSALLASLPGTIDEARLFQVDMSKPVEAATLNSAVLEELYGVISLLARSDRPREEQHLISFRKAFSERYDNEWVSLEEVLNVETGIGYGSSPPSDGSPLLKGMHLSPKTDVEQQVLLTNFQSFLLQRILECARNGNAEVNIHPNEFPVSSQTANLMPDSFSVLVVLTARSVEALKAGEFGVLYKGGVGPSSARQLGRFCTADSELTELVQETLRKEEQHDPEAVYAEIVYLPEGRLGNVLSRPVLRKYEIVHLARSGVPLERQLSASDLLVSVRDDKIVLYSQRLQRRVIPRMSNAHGFKNPGSSVLYKFLGDLQNQGGSVVPSFNWGRLATLDALPRVRVGRVVLALAQWRISEVEAAVICNLDRHAAFVKMKEFQSERKLPRWVTLSEGDNVLPVDLDNPLSVDSLVQLLRRSHGATLVEMYPEDERHCVIGQEGVFEHEIIIPLAKPSPRPGATNVTEVLTAKSRSLHYTGAEYATPRLDRLKAPGSEWHFLKLYGGPSFLDDLLIKEIFPIMSALADTGRITCWFFVRYADPDTHLRVRFQSSDVSVICELTRACESFLDDKKLWKVQCDTYRREIERYGGIKGVTVSEEVFCADSEAVLSILSQLSEGSRVESRWKIALLGTHVLLTNFNFKVEERVKLLDHLRKAFASEFDFGELGKQTIADRFRRERNVLRSILLNDARVENGLYVTAYEAFSLRSGKCRRAIMTLRSLEQSGDLSVTMEELAASYVHMHINRVMRGAPRAHEAVLYDFLYRLYSAEHFRNAQASGLASRKS